MKPRIHAILERCIEEGALLGYRRAYKHIDNPGAESIVDHVTTEIMGKLDELFTFDDP